MARKQAAEEEERSRSVSFKAPAGGMSAILGGAGVAATVGTLGAAAMDADAEAEDVAVSDISNMYYSLFTVLTI